jgi:hypothetical protein
MRGKLACVLADCGFAEAATECQRSSGSSAVSAALDMDAVVRSVLQSLKK